MSFPLLYECSVCGSAVKVTSLGEGIEPEKVFSCDHHDAIIWANRKVTLRGKGEMLPMLARIRLTVRQFLSLLSGRSV